MNQTTVIYNAKLVLETGVLPDAILIFQGDTITAFGPEGSITIPESARRINAQDAYVGPGFVDIHVHGGNGYNTCFQTREAAEHFLRHGTTTLLATPAYSFDFEKFLSAIQNVKAAMKDAPTVRGIYMEGPYTNANYGANSHINPWRGPIEAEQYQALVDEAGDLAKVWVIAPEREGLLPFLEYARKVNPNVKFAVGHSEATPAQIRALGKYAPLLHTHITNATGQPPVPAGTRGVGPDEHCYMTPDVYAEMISDSCGIHVQPDLQRMILRIKGVERTILISDSTTLNNPNPPKLSHVTDLNFDSNGDLAGSKLTLDQACRNVLQATDCSVTDAFRMAATNPAAAIGLNDIGSIAPGKKADLVFVDEQFHVQKVILRGVIQEF